ncbi:MAG: V-type ATPase subunit [Clostridia bacterium]|nr:V-type ATPase subunit [Clostridia bacterium]
MSFASNAVLAKARAMYAGHITGAEYDNLVAAQSLTELLSRLVKRKHYASALEKAHRDITAAQAEELLRISIFEQLSVLSRYEKSGRMDFYKYYIVKNDSLQILRSVRLLISGQMQDYLAQLPPFYDRLTELNLFGLAGARSFEDILSVLQGTPYRKILEPFQPVITEEGAYLRIEAEMNRYLNGYLIDTIKHDKADKKQIFEVGSIILDSRLITSLYRLKKMGIRDERIMTGFFVNGYSSFSPKQVEALLKSQDEKDFMRILSATVYGEALKGLDYGDTEKVMEDYLCAKLMKGLRFYTDPAAIMVCYMFLAENEVKNIVRIIEGIKYGIEPAEIKKVLTGVVA